MVINHNMSAMYANRMLNIKQNQISGNLEKLSSGMRINRGGDDASGLAVSEKLRSQIRGLNQAERNIENGVSFIQTTEGYLQETQGTSPHVEHPLSDPQTLPALLVSSLDQTVMCIDQQ